MTAAKLLELNEPKGADIASIKYTIEIGTLLYYKINQLCTKRTEHTVNIQVTKSETISYLLLFSKNKGTERIMSELRKECVCSTEHLLKKKHVQEAGPASSCPC